MKDYCVHFPRPTDRFGGDLKAVDDSNSTSIELSQAKYIEVTGVLVDLFPQHIIGVGINVVSVRDADAETKGIIAAARDACIAWQQENSARLAQRVHGASVVFNPQNGGADRSGNAHIYQQYLHDCAIWSVDDQLPHENIIIRRKEPKEN